MTLIEISCEEVWMELSNYIEGDVAPELRARMETHFRQCQHCTAIYDGTQNIIQLIGDFQAFDVPRGFSQRLQAKLLKGSG